MSAPLLLHTLSPAAADSLAASFWQSLLLTGAVALLLRLIPDLPARTRASLWTLVLALLIVLPAASLYAPRAVAHHAAALYLAGDWSLGLLCFWAAMSLFRAAQFAVGALRAAALHRRAQPAAVDPAIASHLLAGRRAIALCTSLQVDRPSVVGFFRPRILLPLDLLATLSTAELETIVLHEMEHVRRGDQWTNLLQQLSLILLPWNPAVLWLNRRLSMERELACDDRVLRSTAARAQYAACLVRLAEHSMLRRGVALTLGVLGNIRSQARDSELVLRVRRILAARSPLLQGKALRAVALAVLSAAVGLSVLLARSPHWIEFAASPAELASTSSAPSTQLAASVVTSSTAAYRPMLVKAVMPARARRLMPLQPAHLDRAPLKPSQPIAATQTSEPLRARAVVPHRTLRVTGRIPVWRTRSTVIQPGLTLVSTQDSQTLYAAVPWQGGWLLFQL
jgi:hypothetical protein